MNQNSTIVYVYINDNVAISSLRSATVLQKIILPTSAYSALSLLVCISVLASPNLKDPTYKFLLAIATADFLYMFLSFIGQAANLGCQSVPMLCGSRSQYIVAIMDWIIARYSTSCLAVFSILSEIYLTIDRLLMIQNIRTLRGLTFKHVGPILICTSLIYYSPVWFTFQVVASGRVFVYRNQTYPEYVLTKSAIGKSDAGTVLSTALNFIRLSLVVIVLLILNLITVICFARYINRKKSLLIRSVSVHSEASRKSRAQSTPSNVSPQPERGMESRRTRRIAVMLTATCFVYIAGTTPFVFYNAGQYVNFGSAQPILQIVGIFCIFFYPGVKIYIYLLFNQFFRDQFISYVYYLLRKPRPTSTVHSGSAGPGGASRSARKPTGQISSHY